MESNLLKINVESTEILERVFAIKVNGIKNSNYTI